MNAEEYREFRREQLDRDMEYMKIQHEINAATLKVQLMMMQFAMTFQTVSAMMLNPNVKDQEIIRAIKMLSGKEEA